MQVTRQIRQIVGENILARRTEMKLSRRDLALKLGVDQGVIYKWERGLHRPSEQNLGQLAIELDRDVFWFYVDRGERTAA